MHDQVAEAERVTIPHRRMEYKELGLTVIYRHTVNYTELIQEYKFTFHPALCCRKKNDVVHEDEMTAL